MISIQKIAISLITTIALIIFAGGAFHINILAYRFFNYSLVTCYIILVIVFIASKPKTSD
jgi:hypothetical protein